MDKDDDDDLEMGIVFANDNVLPHQSPNSVAHFIDDDAPILVAVDPLELDEVDLDYDEGSLVADDISYDNDDLKLPFLV